MNKKYILIGAAVLFCNLLVSQFTIPPKPKVQTSLYDYAEILSENERQYLKTKLIRYSDSTSTQIVLITVPTINNEDIGVLTPRWGQEWGIGQEKEDNGVLMLLAEKERRIWIAPGYGAEIKLTAATLGTITRSVIIPEFKKGDYYSGLDKGTDAIFEVLNGTFKAQPKKEKRSFLPVLVFIIVFIVIIILSRNSRGGPGSRSRGGLWDAIILSQMGRSSYGSGSSGGFGSGGGFGGGFGGGGFSGGGGGGSW